MCRGVGSACLQAGGSKFRFGPRANEARRIHIWLRLATLFATHSLDAILTAVIGLSLLTIFKPGVRTPLSFVLCLVRNPAFYGNCGKLSLLLSSGALDGIPFADDRMPILSGAELPVAQPLHFLSKRCGSLKRAVGILDKGN